MLARNQSLGTDLSLPVALPTFSASTPYLGSHHDPVAIFRRGQHDRQVSGEVVAWREMEGWFFLCSSSRTYPKYLAAPEYRWPRHQQRTTRPTSTKNGKVASIDQRPPEADTE
jgi:hypothetical protein